MKNLIMCDGTEIQNHEDTAADFFTRILDLDFDSVLVSDESQLSDFSSCGLPEGFGADAFHADTLSALYNAWDEWVIAEIYNTYRIKIESTQIRLNELFSLIEDRGE